MPAFRLRRATALAAVGLVALAGPTAAAVTSNGTPPAVRAQATPSDPDAEPPASEAPVEDREAVRERLDATDQELAEAQQRLDAALEQLVAVERAEVAAAGALAGLEDELAVARERQAAAAAEARILAEALALDEELSSGRLDRDAARGAFEARVAWVWMHGAAADAHLRLRMAAGARRPHDVLLASKAVDRIIADERATQDDTAAVLAAVISERGEDVDLRDLARRAAFVAGEEAAVVDGLRRRQLAVVANLADLRRQKEAVFGALQNDRDALAALSLHLRRTLARVSLEGALVPPADLPLDGPPPPWVDLLPAAGARWATAVEATAIRNGLDGALFTALVWSESGFRAGAVSHAGAIGLAQLMPGTARGLGVDPYDPYQNLDGGSRYLRAQIEAFGRADLGLAAYNAGPGRVRGAGNQVPNIAETQVYVVRVLERWERLRNAN